MSFDDDTKYPIQVNMADSEIRVNGKTGSITRWVVEFLAPSGRYTALRDIPADERWYARPVPVAYSDELHVICIDGDYEESIVADIGFDDEGDRSEAGNEGNSSDYPISPGTD